MMNKNANLLGGIASALLLVVLMLPVLLGGIGSALFTLLFWLLALGLAMTAVFEFTNGRQQH